MIMMRNVSNILLIKHLPAKLTQEEKSDFLKCFSPSEIRYMPLRSRLKHAAFCTFATTEQAEAALHRLHQLQLLNSTLTAEFSHQSANHVNESEPISNENVGCLKSSEKNEEKLKSCRCSRKLPNIASELGLGYASNPLHKYLYPDPTADVLLNICGALMTVPKFYTQVLHLMNKMNLFPPFSPASLVPQVLIEYFRRMLHHHRASAAHVSPSSKRDLNEATSDMSESEMESDESEQKSFNILPPERATKTLKRKSKSFADASIRKRFQMKPLLDSCLNVSSKKLSDVSEVFEASHLSKNVIQMKLLTSAEESLESPTTQREEKISVNPQVNENMSDGFGKLKPLDKPTTTHETEKHEQYIVTRDFVSEEQLQAGRLSAKEMLKHHLFQKYSTGQPSCRLYVKNLHKKVTERDMQFIFGRFVDFDDDEQAKMFHVRLMTQGRMKGQAFVGLPSVETAKKAVKLCNGYQLIGKPMIVVFARSAKPKHPVHVLS